MTVRWTVRAAELTEQGYARGETFPLSTYISTPSGENRVVCISLNAVANRGECQKMWDCVSERRIASQTKPIKHNENAGISPAFPVY